MRYKVVLAYNGAPYHGWQTQKKGRSIQEEIEIVLSTIHKQPIEVVASGRTDSKVHALGQVFHFDSSIEMDAEGMKKAMNALLTKSIRVQSIEKVSEEFHARFDAIGKRYDYFISQDVNNPFIQDFMTKVPYNLDVEAMQRAAQVFIGEHDFTSFTSSKIDERKSRIKKITRLDVIKKEDTIQLIFEGSGFLRYMVRMITQTLIEVGRHTIRAEDVQNMLEAKSKFVCKYKAEPQGLYLVAVYYD